MQPTPHPRVALVLDRFGASLGGTERWTADFADALLARGHEVHVVCRGFEGGVPDGVRPHRLPPVRGKLKLADAAADLVAGLPVDVVHDMGLGWCADVLHLHSGSRTASRVAQSSPMTAALHAAVGRFLPRHRTFAALDRRRFSRRTPVHRTGPGYRTARRVVAVSRRSAGEVAEYDGVGADRLRVVPNGVDVRRFTPEVAARLRGDARREFGLPQTAPVLLAVAHNHRLKGVPTLLRAAARLARAGGPAGDVRVLIAGGKRLSGTRRLARRLGIADRVTLTGPVDDVRPLYAAADVLVHATRYDPFALVVTEALACGRPVLCGAAAGAAELIPPGAGGVLDDPADDGRLAGRLDAVLRTAADPRTVTAARTAAERHSFAANVHGVLAVYGDLPGTPGRTRRAA